MDLFSSKKLLLGIAMGGMLVGQAQATGYFDTLGVQVANYFGVETLQTPSNKVIGVAAAATFAVVSSYIALTQEKQPVIQTNNPFLKGWNWYRRVFCGQASKKSQKGYLTQTKAHMNEDGTIDFDADLKIKDCYSESSGYVGNLITFYDSNEKDVKKAIGIGAIPLALVLGSMKFSTLKDFLVQHVSKAPYGGELLAKA